MSPKLKPNQLQVAPDLIIHEHPLPFQEEMVKAILEDRKTQTRRTKGLDILNDPEQVKQYASLSEVLKLDGKGRKGWFLQSIHGDVKLNKFITCPYGQPGDLLWVREKFTRLPFDMINEKTKLHFSYFADCDADSLEIAKEYGFKWKPSIHIPKSAARIWLMVEEIRVERVQDISEADAIAEGIEMRAVIDPEFDEPVRGWKDYQTNDWITTGDGLKSPEERSFRSLWKSINGEESWNSNPWVWVIRFKVLSKTGRPSDAVILQNYLEVTGKEVPNA